MTRPEETTPIFDEVAALLADCPPSGPIRPEDEPPLVADVALPTLANGQEADS